MRSCVKWVGHVCGGWDMCVRWVGMCEVGGACVRWVGHV